MNNKLYLSYIRWGDVDNFVVLCILGMKRRLLGKVSCFIIIDFIEVVRFLYFIYFLK